MDSLNIDRFMHEKADKKRNLCMDFLLAANAPAEASADPTNEDPQ